jgi:ubiquitin carboxyl-terminal hydrolase L3
LLGPESLLARFIAAFQTRQPQECAKILEDSIELESIYKEAAMQGDSIVPTDPQEEVDFYYVCFVRTEHSRIYEMDGDRKGPMDKGATLKPEDDMLSEAGIAAIKEYIQRESSMDPNFSLMALVETKSSDRPQ